MPSLSSIYRQHFPYVWAVLRRLGVPEADLEDLAQEVFVVAYRRRDDFQGRSSIRTWLYAIAVRLHLNDRRKRQRRGPTAEVSASNLRVLDEHADPELHVARDQARAILHSLLDNLDDDKRVVFVLSELEGLPAPAIARITGAKTRTVYSRLRAARDRFSADLARVHARERNNLTVQAILRQGSRGDQPSAGTQQRIHAALVARLGLGALVPAVSGWTGLKAAAASLALGAAGLTTITVVADATRARAPQPVTVATRAHPAEQPIGVAETRPSSSASPGGPTLPRADPTEPSKAPRVAKRNPSPSSPPEQTGGEQLAAELALMKQARRALHDADPERALSVLDEHRRRFPDGALSKERDQSRWTALCMAGRVDEARKLFGSPGPCPPADPAAQGS